MLPYGIPRQLEKEESLFYFKSSSEEDGAYTFKIVVLPSITVVFLSSFPFHVIISDCLGRKRILFIPTDFDGFSAN